MEFKNYIAAVLPALLLIACGLVAPLRAGAAEETAGNKANIFYFDPDFQVGIEMISALEKGAQSLSALKIEKVSTLVTYTDNRNFILDNTGRLTKQEIGGQSSYLKMKDVSVIEGGKSFLYSEPDLPEELRQIIDDGISGYFTPQQGEAELVRGTASDGRSFTAVSLKNKKPSKSITPTLMVTFQMRYKGEPLRVTEFARPLGLTEFNRKVKELTALKAGNLLLSITLGAGLANEIKMKFENNLAYLSELKTDLVAVDRDDIKIIREQAALKNPALAAPAVSFICSNLQTSDPELIRLIRPYTITALNGVKTAFISFLPSDSPVISSGTQVAASFINPFQDEFLSKLVKTLKIKEKAAVIVAVSQFEDEEFGKFLRTRGIDVVIGPKSGENLSSKKERVELMNWNRESHSFPALVAARDSRGLGKITLDFEPAGTLKAIESEPVEYDPGNELYDEQYSSFKEQMLRHFLGSDDPLLPDLRRVYTVPGSRAGYSYGETDFYRIVTAILKEHYKTEVALARIRMLSVTVPGDIPSTLVRTWMKPDDRLVIAKVPGALLRELLPLIEEKADGKNDSQKYLKKDFYAVSGLGADGTVSGLKIQRNEMYLAVFSEYTLAALNKLPGAKGLKIIRLDSRFLDSLVLEKLAALMGKDAINPDWERSIKELMDGIPEQKSLWRINLRNLSLLMINTEVRGNGNFGGVSDSQINTSGQTLIQGSGKVFSELFMGRTRLDLGASADYGKVTVRPANQPKLVSESADQLIFESEFKQETGSYRSFLGSGKLGPFANLAYDTEFSRQTGVAFRKIVRGKTGLKLFEGTIVQEFYAAFVGEQNYTNTPAKTNYAVETGYRVNMLIPRTALTLSSEGNYRNFAYSRSDTAADLKQRLELYAKLSTKLYGDIVLSPFVKYFMATGKLFSGTAVNTTIGVTIDYAHLFKLKY